MPTLVSGSVGIVSYPAGAQTAEQLFERADFALYHAKQTRKGGAVLFSAQHESMIREASLVELTLDGADLEREFELVFQPIVDAGTGAITAFEALARWDSPVLGRVRPDVFIRAAERSRTVGRLTEVAVRKGAGRADRVAGRRHLAFNLSAQDIEAAGAGAVADGAGGGERRAHPADRARDHRNRDDARPRERVGRAPHAAGGRVPDLARRFRKPGIRA